MKCRNWKKTNTKISGASANALGSALASASSHAGHQLGQQFTVLERLSNPKGSPLPYLACDCNLEKHGVDYSVPCKQTQRRHISKASNWSDSLLCTLGPGPDVGLQRRAHLRLSGMSQPMKNPHSRRRDRDAANDCALPETDVANGDLVLQRDGCSTNERLEPAKLQGRTASGAPGRGAQPSANGEQPLCSVLPGHHPPWPVLPRCSPCWPQSSPPPLQAETPRPEKLVREGCGGVITEGDGREEGSFDPGQGRAALGEELGAGEARGLVGAEEACIGEGAVSGRMAWARGEGHPGRRRSG